MPSPRPKVSAKANAAKRCVIYTRVSTDDQARRDYSSLKSQRDICKSYINIKQCEGWTEQEVIEDAGYSAKSLDRPGMQKLLGMVKRREIDVIVAYRIDRLSRSLHDFYHFWETLNEHEVEFVSATEQFDTSTTTGRFMLNLILVFAQYERETTVQRTTDKMEERAKRGLWNGGWAPFGYDFDAANKTIVPNPREKAVVVTIFTRLADGGSAAEITRQLDKEGIRTKEREMVRQGKKRLGGGMRFTTDSVKALVRNVTYKGCLSFNGDIYAGQHQPLVSAELWDKANAAVAPRQGLPARRAERDKHNSLLKGIIFCGNCGAALTPHPSGKKDSEGNQYLYYACTSVTKHGVASKCTVRNLPARKIEDLVLGLMRELGEHPNVIAETVDALKRKTTKDTKPAEGQLKEVEQKLRTASQKVEHLLSVAKESGASALSREVMVEAQEAAEEKERLSTRREQLKVEIGCRARAAIDADVVAQQLRDFSEVIGHLEPEEKKEIIRLLIREVHVNHLDPEKGVSEPSEQDSVTQIRTNRFVVNITFYATDLFSKIKRTGVNQFAFEPKWLPG